MNIHLFIIILLFLGNIHNSFAVNNSNKLSHDQPVVKKSKMDISSILSMFPDDSILSLNLQYYILSKIDEKEIELASQVSKAWNFFLKDKRIIKILNEDQKKTNDRENLNPLKYDQSDLFSATEKGDINKVNEIIDTHSFNIHGIENAENLSPLLLACIKGHDQIFKIFLEYEKNLAQPIDQGPYAGLTPFFIAIIGGNKAIVEFFVKNGFDPNQPVQIGFYAGMTPLCLAALYGYVDVIQYLVDSKASVNHLILQGLWNGLNPLYMATVSKHLEAVNLLLKLGSDIQYSIPTDSERKGEFLLAAAEFGFEEIVKYLIQFGVDVNYPNNKGEHQVTALYLATLNRKKNIADLLIHSKANIFHSVPNDAEKKSIFLARSIEIGIEEIVKYYSGLVDMNHPFSDNFYNELSPIHVATLHGQEKILRYLIEQGVDVNVKIKTGKYVDLTSLHIATVKKQTKIVDILLNANASILDSIPKNEIRQTQFFFLAASIGNHVIVKSLIQSGMLIDEIVGGVTPLYLSIMNGHRETSDLLLSCGADITRSIPNDLNQRTKLLVSASAMGNEKLVNQMIQFGLDVNHPILEGEGKGLTALHAAVLNRHKNIVNIFKKAKANSNVIVTEGPHEGLTPIVIALTFKDKEIIELLLDSGARIDPSILENENKKKNCLSTAFELGITRIIEQLMF